MKKNIVKIGVVIIAIAIITTGVVLCINYVNNPKRIFSKVVSTSLTNVANKVDSIIKRENTNASEGTLTLSADIDANSLGYSEFALEEVTAKWNTNTNKKTGMIKADITISVLGQQLLAANCITNTKTSTLYFIFNDMLDKYYMIGQSEKTEDETAPLTATTYANSIANMCKAMIKDEELAVSKVEIDINAKKIDTKKITLNISNDNQARIMKNMAEYVKTDKILFDVCKKRDGMTDEELTQELDKIINGEGIEELAGPIEISMYVKGIGNVVQIEIIGGGDKAKFVTDGEYINFNLSALDVNLQFVTLGKGYTLDVKMEDRITGDTILKVESTDGNNATFSLKNAEEKVDIEGNYTLAKSETQTQLTVKILPVVDEKSIGTINITYLEKLKLTDDVKIVEPTDYVDTKNMTEEEAQKLYGVFGIVALYLMQ